MVPDLGPTNYGPTNTNAPPATFWAGMDFESPNQFLLALYSEIKNFDFYNIASPSTRVPGTSISGALTHTV